MKSPQQVSNKKRLRSPSRSPREHLASQNTKKHKTYHEVSPSPTQSVSESAFDTFHLVRLNADCVFDRIFPGKKPAEFPWVCFLNAEFSWQHTAGFFSSSVAVEVPHSSSSAR
jgi:hypothetical protein